MDGSTLSKLSWDMEPWRTGIPLVRKEHQGSTQA